MPVITNQQVDNIDKQCSNGWKLDVHYYLFHNEKTLIKKINIDDENYLEFKLRYNGKNQISLHISKFYHKSNDKYSSTSGMGKNAVLDLTEHKRKNVSNLIAFTNSLDDEKLMKINKDTKVSSGYGLIIESEEF